MKNPIEYFHEDDRTSIAYLVLLVVVIFFMVLPDIIHGRADSDSQKFQQIEKRFDLLEKAVNVKKR